jgi:xanthine dehydrogenase accessory factor
VTEKRLKDLIILIKGGGEMASGITLRLVRSGFRVCITEIPQPLAVRRGVSFCEAVFEGRGQGESESGSPIGKILRWGNGEVPVLIDPGAVRKVLSPDVLVDRSWPKETPVRPGVPVISWDRVRAGRDVPLS